MSTLAEKVAVRFIAERVAHRVMSASPTYPSFFLRAYTSFVKQGGKHLAEQVASLADGDPVEAKEKGVSKATFVAETQKKAFQKLPKRADDLLEDFLYSDALSEEMQRALTAANSDVTDPTVENVRSELRNGQLKIDFQLWWGLADLDNVDEHANAPDVDALLQRALGSGCSARVDSIERTDIGGMFVFAVTVKKKIDAADLIEKSLSASVRRVIEKDFDAA